MKQQIVDFFSGLFDTSHWPPRWHCGQWSDFHGWLYIISDLMIFSAYFAMPIIIVRYIVTRTSARFHKIYFLFAAFILACGFTHLLDAIIFWYPVYRFNALALFITGAISWTTVYYLIKLLPVAFSLKTAEELEIEVEQRKRIEEDLEVKIRLLNEAQRIARIGHWELNISSGMIIWSDSLFKIYGITQGNEIRTYKSFLEYIHPDDRENFDAMIKQVLTEKRVNEMYYRIISPDGTEKTLQLKGTVVRDVAGEVTNIIATSQDVTEQKNTEQELILKSSELESKNTELQKFAYIASHDLQEPLRKIRTFISRIQSPDESVTPEKEKIFMEKIVNSASRMQRLIDDILSFSRLSSTSIANYQKLDLNNVVNTVLNDLEVSIEENKAALSIASLPVIEGNATQIGQLFQNLLSNAIKFRQGDKHPAIEITSEIISGANIATPNHIKNHYKFYGWAENKFWAKEKFCKIIVSDNGIGFPMEYNERIFEAFQRLSTSYEGTGIGLAICKKIVENHHGVITAESKLNEGTQFIIILPVSQANFGKTTESINN